MKYANHSLVALLLLLGISAPAQAQTPTATLVVVERPWARATPAGAKTGAAYLTVTNNGKSTEHLVGASTPVADKVQFHEATEENGIARMRELRTIEIAPAGKVILKPGHIHVMMIGLKEPLKEGQTFPLTLEFEKAGKVGVVVSVARVGGMDRDMDKIKH